MADEIFYEDLFKNVLLDDEGRHLYLSTYCLHDRHEDCRQVCKVCTEPCICSCHDRMTTSESIKRIKADYGSTLQMLEMHDRGL